ncbi:MAG: HAMP domain-containing histidine kinase [Clostridia bacterium]|nr:HAMP domain-containing histidine kinase [Clostridia bacterium]
MLLFVNVMATSMNIEITNENIESAAKITMLNVLIITGIFTLIDFIRRKLTVERPTMQIIEAGRKVMNGDFSVRIPPLTSVGSDDSFKEIAECFNKMAEELSSTETLRTDFVANVSHELKTPLAIMQNYGSLLSQPDLDDEKRIEYAKGITDASKRLASLITNILKLNKLENQQITPVFESYNLSEQLCECLLGFEEAWEKKGINIETDIEEDIYISSDAEMMSLIWNNLFSNAIKFTDNGGTVSLSVKKESEHVTVKISDTGCGISSEVGKHMFDKFYQGDTSHAMQGNGLGLALVKRVIDITGSDISVESEVGKGTTFTVKIK